MKKIPHLGKKDLNKSYIPVLGREKTNYSINHFSSPSFTSSAPDFGVEESIYTNKFLD